MQSSDRIVVEFKCLDRYKPVIRPKEQITWVFILDRIDNEPMVYIDNDAESITAFSIRIRMFPIGRYPRNQ